MPPYQIINPKIDEENTVCISLTLEAQSSSSACGRKEESKKWRINYFSKVCLPRTQRLLYPECPMRNSKVCFHPHRWQEYQFMFKVQKCSGVKPQKILLPFWWIALVLSIHTGVSNLRHLNSKPSTSINMQLSIWQTMVKSWATQDASSKPIYKLKEEVMHTLRQS